MAHPSPGGTTAAPRSSVTGPEKEPSVVAVPVGMVSQTISKLLGTNHGPAASHAPSMGNVGDLVSQTKT
eukprot:CAMPEP_0172462038 /NCGR_PEP_ID=MMETSP1065-20121228/42541_1 /TAXON_ID=265537 /ORGANISM="Amphiprora paludosa, Strain CCMP125" /LENGTH=68 /DNA_ID=CAMNT_0013217573 /DNA_START=30 /DNA_END=233 /DNA_ORIENTATION=-